MSFEPTEQHPDRRRARVRSVTQHAVEGALPLRVSMPESYIGNPEINFDWGPIHLVLRDEGAVRSLAEGLFELLKVADHAYPNLDAELKRQRLERQRELQREGQESPSHPCAAQWRADRGRTLHARSTRAR
jgi:hypothetical protein